MISVAEFTARAKRLRNIFPDLKISYNEDSGLGISFIRGYGGGRTDITGDTDIIEDAEALAKESLDSAVKEFAEPVTFNEFRKLKVMR